MRGPLRRILRAFRSACHVSEGLDSDAKEDWLQIHDGDVFQAVLRFSLEKLPDFFDILFGYQQRDKFFQATKGHVSDKVRVGSCKAYRSAAMQSMVRSIRGFFRNLLHFANHLAPSDSEMQAFICTQLRGPLLPYLSETPQLCRKFLRVLLEMWSGPDRAMEVRVNAFLCMSKMGDLCRQPFLEQALKGIYLSFVRCAKFVNFRRLPLVNFLANCVVEIFGEDLNKSYQLAFIYIRQLAIHLRNCIYSKSKDVVQNVYNWQFINCLRVWTRVLCTYAGSADMNALIYPLSQVIIGTARLVPSASNFALRLHCVNMLNDLAVHTGVYIPAAPVVMEIFASAEFKRKPDNINKEKRLILETTLKVPKKATRGRAYHELMMENSIYSLTHHFAAYARNIAFPEIITPTMVQLKKLRSTNALKSPTFNRMAGQLLEKLKRNAEWVRQARAKAEFSPKDIEKCVSFLQPGGDGLATSNGSNAAALAQSPLEQHAAQVRAMQDKRLEDAAKEYNFSNEEQEQKPSKKSKKDQDESESDEESESESENESDEESEQKQKNTKRKNVNDTKQKAKKRGISADVAPPEAGDDVVMDMDESWSSDESENEDSSS